MKEYNSIQLQDDEFKSILKITELIGEPLKAVKFEGNINSAIKNTTGLDTVTFWYEKNHVMGLFFLSSDLKKLPVCIEELQYLKFLVIISSEISIIPPNLGQLKKLEYIEIQNDLDVDPMIYIELPNIFHLLTQLRKIKIFGNFTIFLPPSIIKTINLEELHLEECFFYTDYKDFLHVLEEDYKKFLQDLELHFKTFSEVLKEGRLKVSTLPANINLLSSLKKIYLRNIRGLKIPLSIKDLQNLKELDIVSSEIINLDIIFDISSLEILNLINCGLKSIPMKIKHFDCLKLLDVTNNRIQEIPFEITFCRKLERLFVKGNCFKKTFVKWIHLLIKLPKLRYFEIDAMYHKIIPKEIIEIKKFQITY